MFFPDTHVGGLDQAALRRVRSGKTSYYQEMPGYRHFPETNPAGADPTRTRMIVRKADRRSTGSITNRSNTLGVRLTPRLVCSSTELAILIRQAARFLEVKTRAVPDWRNIISSDTLAIRPTKFTDAFGPAAINGDKKELWNRCRHRSYDVNGSAPGGTTFHWNASYIKNDSTAPIRSAVRVRQSFSWKHATATPSRFPSNDQPKNWYEDRDQKQQAVWQEKRLLF